MQGVKEHKSAGKSSGPASSSSAEVQESSSNDSARLNSQASTATTARTNITTTTAASSTTSSSSALSDYQNPDKDQNKEKSENEKEESNDNKTPNILLFSTLLGKGITSWPYNEQTLADALKLKLEQEKTKQEFYRLETMKRSLEVLKQVLLQFQKKHLFIHYNKHH
ncbi:unnamed protein product [[Candida] boidinii]|uniref:Unnamed protein product n=1 Tax=Candida boidinii TaxID=5477 RepID=A0ACB5TP47_CANBO|nr:unnamed protein product [[Candida] boidinii]